MIMTLYLRWAGHKSGINYSQPGSHPRITGEQASRNWCTPSHGLSLVSVNRGLLEPTPLIHSLMDCLRLLLCLHSKLWKVQERPNGLQSLKHLLPGRHWSNLDHKDWNLFAILNKCLHNLCSQWPKEYLSCTFILGLLLVKNKSNLGFI